MMQVGRSTKKSVRVRAVVVSWQLGTIRSVVQNVQYLASTDRLAIAGLGSKRHAKYLDNLAMQVRGWENMAVRVLLVVVSWSLGITRIVAVDVPMGTSMDTVAIASLG